MDIRLFISLAGFALSAISFYIGRRTGAETTGKKEGQILSDIGYIKSGNDGIQKELRRLREESHRFEKNTLERLTAVEQSAKSAHIRINEVAQQLDKGA